MPLRRRPGDAAFEPSGIVWDGGDWLYAVSDGGMIARRAIKAQDDETWVCLYKWCGDADQDPRGKAENDFESVAFVPSPEGPRYIWVGVEGTVYSVPDPNDAKKKISRELRPQIKKFDTRVGQFAGGHLSLGGIPFGAGNGVESMTFVPDPSTLAQKGPSNTGGYFIASSQFHDEGQPGGKVYIFHADTPPRQDPQGEWYTPPSGQPFFLPDGKGGSRNHKNSDFYYSPDSCALYVTYDDESDAWTLDTDGRAQLTTGSQSLWIYTTKETAFPLLTAETPPAPFLFSSEHKLPASRGLEGVTAVTTSAEQVTLYTAIDMSTGQNPGTPAVSQGTHFNTKDEIKAAKGSPLPSAIDRYTPLERTRSPFCPF